MPNSTAGAAAFDENCDPNNPVVVKFEDIEAAAHRIAGTMVRTPLLKAHLGQAYGMEIYYKAEFFQPTGSFKERGVSNLLATLTEDQKKHGVISATTGNHGSAMCYHTLKANIPCHVVMPTNSSPMKIAKCKALLGNRVIIHGDDIMSAKLFALELAKEKKMLYVNGYDHIRVIEGQGTVGLEVVEQLSTVDAVLVPVGGGSLLAGIANAIKHLKPDTEIYGIETEKTCSMTESVRRDELTAVPYADSIADGLAVSLAGVNSFASIKGMVDKMVVVKEEWVMRAIMHLLEDEKIMVEGAGATAFAAIMAGMFENLKGKKVVCICSGGNMDSKVLSRAIERALGAEGRLVKFKVTVADRPGGAAELCALLTGIGVGIRDMLPDRTWVKSDVFSVQMKVVAEVTGMDQLKELTEVIKRNYKEYYFHEINAKTKSAPTRRGPCLAPNPVCMQK
ncbi:unnamed protein product [Plutella xylostella]|uniref:L-serine deaminase n=1 Tax=Plutella xylostella TaxID=51655 RepID=A0A8S4FZB0_PLUXY|nr:unnamed protein product [Plutella xylostella]